MVLSAVHRSHETKREEGFKQQEMKCNNFSLDNNASKDSFQKRGRGLHRRQIFTEDLHCFVAVPVKLKGRADDLVDDQMMKAMMSFLDTSQCTIDTLVD